MRQIIYIFFIFLTLYNCKVKNNDRPNDFKYDYEIRSYFSNSDDPKNFHYSEYYHNDTLIRKIGSDGNCFTYTYNKDGRISETKSGRKCDFGWRKIFIYDSLNNHIGYYETFDSIVNLDTVFIDQVFFYDSQNRLIKERTNKRKDIHGNEFEEWNHYKYLGNLIDHEIIIENLDTIWDGKFHYDSIGNITKIHRVRKKIYETEELKYNLKGLLIEKKITSNEFTITPKVSFYRGNSRIIYEYDSTGFLTTERIIGHRGNVFLKTIYLKIKNNKKTP